MLKCSPIFLTLLLFFSCKNEKTYKVQEIVADEIIKYDKDNVGAFRMKITALIERGHCDEALSAIEKVLLLDKNSSDLYALSCRAKNCVGRYEEAKKDCRKALSIDKSNQYANVNYSWAFLSTGDFDEAITKADKVISANPSDEILLGVAYNNRGMAKMMLKQYPEAEADFMKSIRRNQASELPYIGLASINAFTGRFDEAMKNIEIALDRNPNKAQAHWTLGIIYLAQENTAKACEAFDEALRIGISTKLPGGRTAEQVRNQFCN